MLMDVLACNRETRVKKFAVRTLISFRGLPQVAIRWAQATRYDPHEVNHGYRLKWESESSVRIVHGEESEAVEVPPLR